MGLSDIADLISKKEFELAVASGNVEALKERQSNAEAKAKQAQSMVEACEQASQILARYADERQAKVMQTIEAICSEGLSQIFDEPIQLKIVQTVRARRVEMDVLVRTGELETPVLEARGGGLAAVVGFILRACVLLLTPGARRILVLDEVFAHLSEQYVTRCAEFIRELSERTGLQIILVTHQTGFAEAAHKVYRIEKVSKDESRFVEENVRT